MKKYKMTKVAKERHGMRYTRFYSIWCGMKTRCLTKTSKDFPNYGGKGITVSKDWIRFTDFMNDMLSSYIQHALKYGEADTTIERIDNKKGYSKQNCRWATRKQQNNNKTYGFGLLIRNSLGRFIGSKKGQTVTGTIID